MAKPDDIPQDAWNAADGTTNRISSELVKALTGGTEATADGLIQAHVARAIMAERERCAKLVDEGFDREVGQSYRDDGVRSKNDLCVHQRLMYEDCEACAAAAIRKGAQ